MHHQTFPPVSSNDDFGRVNLSQGSILDSQNHSHGHGCGCNHCQNQNRRISLDGDPVVDDSIFRGNSSRSPLTNNVYIDGILWGGNYVTSAPITYSFWNNPSLDDNFGDTASANIRSGNLGLGRPDVWNAETRASMELALEMWSNVANIRFEQVADNSDTADFGFLLVNNQEIGEGVLGQFGPPGTRNAGIGYFNHSTESWSSQGLPQGSLGFVTLLHELGHGLGLAHPHDNGGTSPQYPGVLDSSDTGRNALNQGVYTTMTYNDGLNGNASLNYGNQGTPMAFDIAAIQHLYGPNLAYNSDDTTYQLPDQNKVGTYYSSIWDGGGTDTISAQGINLDATIDLNEAPLEGPNAGGYLSKADGIDGGFTIAHNVTIENAIGGGGDDVIIGNATDNTLEGSGGADVLMGHGGDDTLLGMVGDDLLDGGVGSDQLDGGQDRDKLYGEQDSDRLYGGRDQDRLYGGQDSDRLHGEQDRDRLYGGQDNDVIKGGQGRDDLYGGQGDDRLFGGADNDRLEGGGGSDVLYGDGGADLFVLATGKGTDTIKDFDVLDDSLGLGAGLSFSDLTVVQQKNRVAIDAGSDRLALLPGVDANQLTSDRFQVV